ncbi:MAG TPA: porin family protein [Cytophagaceae bacterium]
MYQFNFWNSIHLYRKKGLILFILTLLVFNANAQLGTTINLPKYDDKIMHYGFTIGVNSTRFKPVHSASFLSDSALVAQATSSPGFSLGFIVSYKLAEFFDIRLQPTVAFYERKMKYSFPNSPDVEQITESTFIEMPLLLKYKSQRRKNTRMYMIGGIKPGIEAGAKKKDKKANELRTNNIDFSIEYGFGFDFYYPLFKFAPEIRFSHGIINLLNDDPNIYSRSLNVLTTHTVSLFLNFE